MRNVGFCIFIPLNLRLYVQVCRPKRPQNQGDTEQGHREGALYR